jgi:hypothetical protein
MEYPGESSEFHFSAPRHHLNRCPAFFASRHQANRSM